MPRRRAIRDISRAHDDVFLLLSVRQTPSRRMVLGGVAARCWSCRDRKASRQRPNPLSSQPRRRNGGPACPRAADLLVWAYNGEAPGPVLRLQRGLPQTIRLVNNLPQPTSFHVGGLRHANAAEASPADPATHRAGRADG